MGLKDTAQALEPGGLRNLNIRTVTIDDFEDQDIAEYTHSGDSDGFAVDDGSTIGATPQEGSYMLHFSAVVSSDSRIIADGTTLPHPESGDEFEGWFRTGQTNNSDGGFLFGVNGTSSHYYVTRRNYNNEVAIEKDYSAIATDATDLTGGTWYYFNVQWNVSGNGDIIFTIYDSAAKSTQVTQLTANDTTYTSGGHGFNANAGGGSNPEIGWDKWKIV